MLNPKIRTIQNQQILEALVGETRQYLVGDLKKPQKLKHIQDKKIEIGITAYEKPTTELPHTHSQAYEYHFLISGKTTYLDIDANKEYHFETGDFYIIEPGIRYAQKSTAGTKLLFIKVPPGNDKIPIEPSEDVKKWLSE